MMDATANPRQQNDRAPTMTVTARAGAVWAGTWAPNATHPIASSSVVVAAATTPDVRARPPISAAAGTGVARRRFSTPDSRWAVTEITRLMNAAEMMPRVMIPGTYDTPVSS